MTNEVELLLNYAPALVWVGAIQCIGVFMILGAVIGLASYLVWKA